jgi:glutamate 5-kinase
MSTKLTAARLATSAGVTTIITRSSIPSNIFHIVAYVQSIRQDSKAPTPAISRNSSHIALASLVRPADPVAPSTLTSATQSSTTHSTTTIAPKCPLHTRFVAKPRAIRDRYFWILHGLKPHGTLVIDEGAFRALTRTDKAGLLPVGVLDVNGVFAQQECVSIVVAKRNADGTFDILGPEVGRALVNYTSVEISRIKGHRSSRIQELLGYAGKDLLGCEWRFMLTELHKIPNTLLTGTTLLSSMEITRLVSV